MKRFFYLYIFLTILLFSKDVFAYDWNITQLTNNSYDDGYPDMNSTGEIVWSSNPYTNSEDIFLWDNSFITQITSNFARDAYPNISNNGQVVWRGYDANGLTQVFQYDSGSIAQLTNDDSYYYTDAAPKIASTGQVTWIGYDSVNHPYLFYYDGSYAYQVPDSEYATSPQINSYGQVVWNYSGDNINIYDGSTTTPIPNTQASVSQQINTNGQVVWEKWDGNDKEIFFYDGLSTHQITDNLYWDADPQLNDNGTLLWRGYPPGHINSELFIFGGSSIKSIADGGGDYQINNDGNVAWLSNGQILFYDGSSIIPLADNVFTFQLNGNRLAWMGWDGNDYEIYKAELSVVPEPASMALFGLGGAAISFIRRKRCVK